MKWRQTGVRITSADGAGWEILGNEKTNINVLYTM